MRFHDRPGQARGARLWSCEDGATRPLQSSRLAASVFYVGGSEGIRTPGRLPYGGFQNRCLRPLGHASARGNGGKSGGGQANRLRIAI